MEQWWKLKDVPNGKILMSLSWLDTTKDISVLEGKSSLYFRSFRVSKQIDRCSQSERYNQIDFDEIDLLLVFLTPC